MNEDILGLEYDLDKMKKNIRDLMTDSHMTQEQLERKRRTSNRMDARTNSEAQGKERRKTEQRSY